MAVRESTGKCQKCGMNPIEHHDKKYKEDLCTVCWNRRLEETMKVSDYEWYEANKLVESLSPEQKAKIGA